MSTQTETRSLNELLLLDTYQGMTDEEIEMVIEYKARQEFHSLESTAKQAELIQKMNYSEALNAQSLQMIRDTLESIKDSFTVKPEFVKPTLVGFNDTEV